MARLIAPRKGNSTSIVPALLYLCFLLLRISTKAAAASSPSSPVSRLSSILNIRWFKKKSQKSLSSSEKDENMGQAMRAMKYDRAANERAAIPVLNLAGQGLEWFRLDDGVMGGRSETVHTTVVKKEEGSSSSSSLLHFTGTINTNGGGFASIRAKFPPGKLLTETTRGIKIRFRGDGKTYKLLLSEGRLNTGAPMSRTPSWQADIPTTRLSESETDHWQETVILFDTLLPSFGGGPVSPGWGGSNDPVKFDPAVMTEVGLMLSLKLSSGADNPKETFGEGIFPFSFHVESMEPVGADACATE